MIKYWKLQIRNWKVKLKQFFCRHKNTYEEEYATSKGCYPADIKIHRSDLVCLDCGKILGTNNYD